MVKLITTFTCSNGMDVPVYVDMATGQTFTRTIDVGRVIGLSDRNAHRWAAQFGVSKHRVPDAAGHRQIAVTVDYEAVFSIAADEGLAEIANFMMGYEIGFARAVTADTDGKIV